MRKIQAKQIDIDSLKLALGDTSNPSVNGLKIQYSADADVWQDTVLDNDATKYIRFSTDNGNTWSNSISIKGKSLEFAWDDTKLGIRQEGDANYVYTELSSNIDTQFEAGTGISISENTISIDTDIVSTIERVTSLPDSPVENRFYILETENSVGEGTIRTLYVYSNGIFIPLTSDSTDFNPSIDENLLVTINDVLILDGGNTNGVFNN